ncbi:unnamed protein product [Gadus morhua 'NCC']
MSHLQTFPGQDTQAGLDFASLTGKTKERCPTKVLEDHAASTDLDLFLRQRETDSIISTFYGLYSARISSHSYIIGGKISSATTLSSLLFRYLMNVEVQGL